MRPALAEEGIRIVSGEELSAAESEALDRIFSEQIFPVLTPLAVGPGRPFPYISNLSLSIGVWVYDPVHDTRLFARVKVPREVLPRFVDLGDGAFVPQEVAIARNLDALFPGMEVQGHAVFRVTRDADFEVSDEADDLLRAVEDELRARRFGEVVRLEVEAGTDPALRDFLVEQLGIEESEVVDVEGLLDLGDLWQLHGLDGYSHLHEESWTPVNAGAVRLPRRQGRRDGRHARGRPAGAPPLRLVRGQRGTAGGTGRARPAGAGDQDDRVPHLRRLEAGAAADRGGRAGQAGGLPRGAEGALRRAPQHRLGALARGGGRPRRARPARA